MQSRRRPAILSPLKRRCYSCWLLHSAPAIPVERRALLADTLPEAAMGRNIRLTGVVDSLPDRTARGQRFHFKVEQVDSNFHVPGRYNSPFGIMSARTEPAQHCLTWDR